MIKNEIIQLNFALLSILSQIVSAFRIIISIRCRARASGVICSNEKVGLPLKKHMTGSKLYKLLEIYFSYPLW